MLQIPPVQRSKDQTDEGAAVDDSSEEDSKEGDPEEEGEGTGGEDGLAQTKKSDLTEATLVKALNEMDTLVKASANGVSPRQANLASKLAKGEQLTKSERAELAQISAGEDDTDTSFQ